YPDFLPMPILGTVGLLVGGLGSTPTFVGRLLSTPPMVWLGDRSYSWYLWHWPSIVYAQTLFAGSLVAAPLAALLSLVPAALSFQFVDDPIRRGQRWPSNRATAWIASACVVVPLACASAV